MAQLARWEGTRFLVVSVVNTSIMPLIWCCSGLLLPAQVLQHDLPLLIHGPVMATVHEAAVLAKP